jgi:hypothetical protein
LRLFCVLCFDGGFEELDGLGTWIFSNFRDFELQ